MNPEDASMVHPHPSGPNTGQEPSDQGDDTTRAVASWLAMWGNRDDKAARSWAPAQR